MHSPAKKNPDTLPLFAYLKYKYSKLDGNNFPQKNNRMKSGNDSFHL